MSRDPRFSIGVEHFNRREFYDAHEVWEELWNDLQGDDHHFVQGLIQFATSLHHFEAGNLKGARILYDGGTELLKPFSPSVRWGVDVGALMADMRACLSGVLEIEYARLPGRYDPQKEKFPVKIDTNLIPRIALRPEAPHA